MYKKQTEAVLKRVKKRDVKCPECNDLIQRKSFLKHRTERGCPRIDLRIKMSNWSVENYLQFFELHLEHLGIFCFPTV